MIFKVDENSPPLSAAAADRFISTVYKLAHVGLRGRPDQRLALGFLMTRVSRPTVEDQDKLKRYLGYVAGTFDLILTLAADSLTEFWAWVDVAFATHPDRKSHTGGCMSFGRGTFLCMSNKHKLVSRSTTESEFVGASDYVPNIIWVKAFLKGQGYEVKTVYLQQDNESAIKLLTNGRKSAGKQSRHIDIRYWWTKDRLEQHDITVQYCPTLEMLADYLTKPLQGALFRKFRSVLLGYEHISTLLAYLHRSPEERIGVHENDGTAVASEPPVEPRSWLRALTHNIEQVPERASLGGAHSLGLTRLIKI